MFLTNLSVFDAQHCRLFSPARLVSLWINYAAKLFWGGSDCTMLIPAHGSTQWRPHLLNLISHGHNGWVGALFGTVKQLMLRSMSDTSSVAFTMQVLLGTQLMLHLSTLWRAWQTAYAMRCVACTDCCLAEKLYCCACIYSLANKSIVRSFWMQLQGTNVTISIAFPPDTDTPGYKHENESKVKTMVAFLMVRGK